MNYDEFIAKGNEFYMDMVHLIDIKLRHRIPLSDQEKLINGYILEYQEKVKLNELIDKFNKCWELDK